MNDDRELLELAAKAVGYSPWGSNEEGPIFLIEGLPFNWNPLTDDGDAFRLMVKFRMWRECDDDICCVEDPEDHSGDEFAAVRRAIVRAAAEIGKAMP